MAKLNEYTDRDLLNELTLRGYNLDLIYSPHFVEEILGNINQNRDVEDRIVLDDDDIEYILYKSVARNSRFCDNQIRENIIEQILEF